MRPTASVSSGHSSLDRKGECSLRGRRASQEREPTRGGMHVAESERSPESSNGHAKKYAPALEVVANTAGEIRRLDRELVEKVRERPLAAVAIALAAGYVIGRVFSR